LKYINSYNNFQFYYKLHNNDHLPVKNINESFKNDDFEDRCFDIENLFIDLCSKYSVYKNDILQNPPIFNRVKADKSSNHYLYKKNRIDCSIKIPIDKISNDDINLSLSLNQKPNIPFNSYINSIDDRKISFLKNDFKNDIRDFVKRVENHYQTIEDDSEILNKKNLNELIDKFPVELFRKKVSSYDSQNLLSDEDISNIINASNKIPSKQDKMMSNIKFEFKEQAMNFFNPDLNNFIGYSPIPICIMNINFYWK